MEKSEENEPKRTIVLFTESAKEWIQDVKGVVLGLERDEFLKVAVQGGFKVRDKVPVTSFVTGAPVLGNFICEECQVSLDTSLDKYVHVKSPYHRINRKRLKLGLRALSYASFSVLSDDEMQNMLRELRNAVEQFSFSNWKFNNCLFKRGSVYFETRFGDVYSCNSSLFYDRNGEYNVDAILPRLLSLSSEKVIWIVMLIASGNFAGAVFERGVMIEHRCFHRYTNRAKTGGAQCSKDNRGQRYTASAGALIRRHNEQALIHQIHDLIFEWSKWIESSEILFFHCSNEFKSTVFEKTGISTATKRPAMRPIPFSTGRPTLEEVKRVYKKLITVQKLGKKDYFLVEVYRSLASEQNLEIQPLEKEVEHKESLRDLRRRQKAANDEIKLEREQMINERKQKLKEKKELKLLELAASRQQDTERATLLTELRDLLFTACSNGHGLSRLEAFLSEGKLPREVFLAECVKPYDVISNPTALHLAIVNNQIDAARFLIRAGCSPGVSNGEGLTPYQLAGEKMKRCLIEMKADTSIAVDWSESKVPSSVEEMTEELKQLALKEKKADARRARRQRQRDNKAKLGKEQLEQEEREKQQFLASSEEDKAGKERCYTCGMKINLANCFHFSNFIFCTVQCLRVYRYSSTNS
ncbi:Protein vms-1 [Trichinella pseudospiralis]|uniref:Protein vms-1 n=1 Tax=Trichinella pseudospiralis TaxID=6337 RepID=A0A0V1G137_TRIPS|nr:Protein vms-1 [Trichinella pseudospiralis]